MSLTDWFVVSQKFFFFWIFFIAEIEIKYHDWRNAIASCSDNEHESSKGCIQSVIYWVLAKETTYEVEKGSEKS